MRREDGFTMVETLVALILCVLGVLSTLQLLDTSRRGTIRAEESQLLDDIGQRELEKVRRLPYRDVALTGMPAYSSNPNHPGNRVSSAAQTFDLRFGSEIAPMVLNGGPLQGGGQVTGGQVTPMSSFSAGDISGEIHRYVVWRNDPKCTVGACAAGPQDYKRVVVAVTITKAPSATFERAYQEFQTDLIDPGAGTIESGGPGGSPVVTAQQFWLSDTGCKASGEPARVNPTANHVTNDTIGNCNDLTGIPEPDALLSEQPPDPTPDDPATPPFYDFAEDLEATCEQPPSPTCSGAGLQMLRQDLNGCDPAPTGPDAKKKIHWWVTKNLPLTGGFVLTGDLTLELYTQTIDAAPASGAVCVYMYKRAADGILRASIPLASISTPTPGFTCSTVASAPNVFGKCAAATWPAGSGQRVRIRMGVTSVTLLLNERLEIGLSVERGGTPADSNALQFLYDHPLAPSRIEILTTTPLP